MRPTTISRRGITTGTSTRILRMKHNYRRAVLATNPVGYWRLGEAAGTVARDEMGANHGTYVGSPTLGVAGLLTGDGDKAVTFAAGKYVTGMSDAAFPAGAAPRTITWWQIGNSATNNPVFIYGGADPNVLYLYISTTGILTSYVGGSVSIGAGFKSASTVFGAAVYDGSGWVVYKDGVAQARVNQAMNTTLAGASVSVGWERSTNYFTGTLDEPAIWDRALTADEIFRLWRIGAI